MTIPRCRRPMPTCLTCGQPVKRRWVRPGVPTKYCCLAHVPKEARQQGGRKSGADRQAKARLTKFKAELARLRALPKITGEDLLASFQSIADRVYQDGYWACEAKWRYRAQQGARWDKAVAKLASASAA